MWNSCCAFILSRFTTFPSLVISRDYICFIMIGVLYKQSLSISSVEQFLNQREMDPETLLNNLGFGIGPTTEDPLYKIPDRFLLDQRTTRGINLYEFVLSHPELHHLLPIWEKQCPMKRNSPGVGAGSNMQSMSNGTGHQKQESTKGQSTNPNLFIVTESDLIAEINKAESDYPYLGWENLDEGNEKIDELNDTDKAIDKGKLLELCGIVPERYIINAAREKRSSAAALNKELTEQELANLDETDKLDSDVYISSVDNPKDDQTCCYATCQESTNQNSSKDSVVNQNDKVYTKGDHSYSLKVDKRDVTNEFKQAKTIIPKQTDATRLNNELIVELHANPLPQTSNLDNKNIEHDIEDAMNIEETGDQNEETFDCQSWSSSSEDSMLGEDLTRYYDVDLDDNETVV